ncbi:MAG: TrmH family RNA methyltransferase [Pelolinea sp.]|nr:TrmH family RNA methyltransferase [Pelolinea sp.]
MIGSLSHSVIRECSNPDCKFRFPDTNSQQPQIPCPICNSPTNLVNTIDLSQDNRRNNFWKIPQSFIAVIDNVRSVYNVGAIFRTAIGFGLSKIYLCGITPTPSHKNFSKVSLGAEKYMLWERSLNCVDLIIALKNAGSKIVSVETSKNATSILDANKDNFIWKDFALVVGNEISGIDPKIISMSDLVFSIPINGENKSFNVTTAFGIALYHLASIVSA